VTKGKIKALSKNLITGKPDEPFTWARYSSDDVNIEVSSAGDKRFSAMYARIEEDGPTIEWLYQTKVKGYNSIKEGKGKPPKNNKSREELWREYKDLWRQWVENHPDEFNELAKRAWGGVEITDRYANTDINQARALSELLNEYYYYKTRQPTWGAHIQLDMFAQEV